MHGHQIFGELRLLAGKDEEFIQQLIEFLRRFGKPR